MTEETIKTEERDEKLQRYELVYLISNKFAENELEPITSSVLKLIKDGNGQIITKESWGKKRLSYSINHLYHAYYELVEFDLPTSSLAKLEKHLRLSEEIIRHLIVKKRIASEAEIAKNKKIDAKIAKIQKEEEVEEEKPTEAKKEKKKEVSMEELDEKLDKILDDTDKLL